MAEEFSPEVKKVIAGMGKELDGLKKKLLESEVRHHREKGGVQFDPDPARLERFVKEQEKIGGDIRKTVAGALVKFGMDENKAAQIGTQVMLDINHDVYEESQKIYAQTKGMGGLSNALSGGDNVTGPGPKLEAVSPAQAASGSVRPRR